MSINTQFAQGVYNKKVASFSAQSVVEIKIGEELGEIIFVYPQVSSYPLEMSDGKVTYSGKLVCTIVYLDEKGKLCRVQKGAEFIHFVENSIIAPSYTGECALKCVKVSHKREGSACIIDSVIGANVDIFASSERSFVTSIEGAICRNETLSVGNIVTFFGEGEVEDEFECNAEDILIPAATATVLSAKCQKGTVEVEGEIYFSILAVRDSSPVCLDRVVPFKNEILCDDALIDEFANCRAEIKDINVNAKVNEEKGKCAVQILAQLSFVGNFVEEEEINAVVDSFSEDCELKLTTTTEEYFKASGVKVVSERVGGRASQKAEIDYTCAFKAAILPTSEWARTDSGIEGVICANLLYEQGGELKNTEICLPFAITLNDINVWDDIQVVVCGMSVRQREEGICEGEGVVKVFISSFERVESVYLSNAAEGDKYEQNDSAISVYIPFAGDTLWQTAKKLKRSPESIEKTNSELKFPLCGNERIVVYRNKKV